jgi:hypothetical protein
MQRRRAPSISPRKRLAWWWVCGLWLCALVHLSSLAHFALVNHAVCQQHGDLSHASHDALDGEDSGFASDGGASDTHTHLEAGQAPEEHTHCALPADRAAISELPARLGEVQKLEDDAPGPMVVALSRASERARYRLAPKTSPPA